MKAVSIIYLRQRPHVALKTLDYVVRMSTNKLKLNPDKTEFLLIGNERQWRKYLSMFAIELLGVKTIPAKSARNLGVIFDKKFHLALTYFCSL